MLNRRKPSESRRLNFFILLSFPRSVTPGDVGAVWCVVCGVWCVVCGGGRGVGKLITSDKLHASNIHIHHIITPITKGLEQAGVKVKVHQHQRGPNDCHSCRSVVDFINLPRTSKEKCLWYPHESYNTGYMLLVPL